MLRTELPPAPASRCHQQRGGNAGCDEVIAWRALGDTTHDGRITFELIGPDQTRIHLRFEHDPSGMVEKAGEKIGVVAKRMEGDLERFKHHIAERGVEEGGWRGNL